MVKGHQAGSLLMVCGACLVAVGMTVRITAASWPGFKTFNAECVRGTTLGTGCPNPCSGGAATGATCGPSTGLGLSCSDPHPDQVCMPPAAWDCESTTITQPLGSTKACGTAVFGTCSGTVCLGSPTIGTCSRNICRNT